MRKDVTITPRLVEYIEIIQQTENEFSRYKKSFSRVANYLIVLGLEKYKEINNIEPELLDTSFFNFNKRMGYHPYKEIVDPEMLAKKRERLKEKLMELKNKAQETQEGLEK